MNLFQLTPYEQVVLFFVILYPVVIGAIWVLDYTLELIDTIVTRKRIWHSIDRRCAMERHPSYQQRVFDQDAEV